MTCCKPTTARGSNITAGTRSTDPTERSGWVPVRGPRGEWQPDSEGLRDQGQPIQNPAQNPGGSADTRIARRANPMAKRSSGWKVLSTHIQTGGRRRTVTTGRFPATRTATNSSQNHDTPASSGKRSVGDLEGLRPRVGLRPPAVDGRNRSVVGPNALRGGKGTACPMETSAATPGEKRG